MNEEEKLQYSRRRFLKTFSAGVGGLYVVAQLPQFLRFSDGTIAIPASEGYLLVDTKKCSGCMSCMLACSLVHEGKENICLSRIQIVQDSFGRFPSDITIAQCRQCEDPLCVRVCETKALQAEETNRNVRVVDDRKCIGCMRCVQVCPFMPSRVQWNFETKRAQKCDLCSETPFWNERGGAGGKQACVEVCPVRAIEFTDEMPLQKGDSGYNVNLRNENWGKLGFPIT
jgi:protein NrfC